MKLSPLGAGSYVGKPAAADRLAGEKRGAIHALPLPEMLFGERRFLRHGGRLWKTRSPDRLRGLMRALQIACVPHRVARQDLRDRFEHFAVAGVAGDVFLSVDVAAIA